MVYDFDDVAKKAMEESEYKGTYDLFEFLTTEMVDNIEDLGHDENGEIDEEKIKSIIKLCIKSYWEGYSVGEQYDDPQSWD